MSERDDERHGEAATGSSRRWWIGVCAAVVIGFVVLVTTSTQQSTSPSNGGKGMNGMSMRPADDRAMRMSVRDMDGRALRIPDDRPGVVVFIRAAPCRACIAALGAAQEALQKAPVAADLVVVDTDAPARRKDVAPLLRMTGQLEARLIADDASKSLASMFGARRAGSTAVYDASGAILGHPTTADTINQLLTSIRR
jgi:hypothetical protein